MVENGGANDEHGGNMVQNNGKRRKLWKIHVIGNGKMIDLHDFNQIFHREEFNRFGDRAFSDKPGADE